MCNRMRPPPGMDGRIPRRYLTPYKLKVNCSVFVPWESVAVIHSDATGRADDVESRAWAAVQARLGETFPHGTGSS